LLIFVLSIHGTSDLSKAAMRDKASFESGIHRAQITSIEPAELDRSLNNVLSQSQYSWRMPRNGKSQNGIVVIFVKKLLGWARSFLNLIGRWLKAIWDWISGLFPDPISIDPMKDTSANWTQHVRTLIFVLLALAACALGILFWQIRKRHKIQSVTACEMISPIPDLADDDVGADELPANRWIAMAQDLIEKKEYRLAIRALYLACLSCLAEQEMIIIAKFKSNRDYERDLRRRHHAKPGLLTAFKQNLTIFENCWYGTHELTQEEVNHFTANLERIKSCA